MTETFDPSFLASEDSESGAATSGMTTGTSVATAAFGVATTTTGQSFGHTIEGPASGMPSGAPVAGLPEWLDSPDALAYRGRWVLLGADLAPVAVADSPAPLLHQHVGDEAPLIVFVDPRDRLNLPLSRLDAPAQLEFRWAGLYEEAERPLIEVEFAATTSQGVLTGQSIRTVLLVDSGARSTLLDGNLAAALGVDLSSRDFEQRYVGGVVYGSRLKVAKARILAHLCGRWVRIPVNFTLDPVPVTNLLGRDGVFDRHLIAFAHGQRVVLAAEPVG